MFLLWIAKLKKLQNPNFLTVKEVPKTDNSKDNSENPKKKLKDISNTDKETYE